MSAPHYNKEEFNEILSLKFQKRKIEVLKKYQNYVKKYPNDIAALVSYTSFLLDFGFIEEAKEILGNIKVTENINDKILSQLIFTKIKLFGCLGNYQKCYKLVRKYTSILKESREDYYFINTFLKKKLGLKKDKSIKTYSYTIAQVLEYSEQLAIEHIKKHDYQTDKNNSKFVENFPIEEYYYKIKEMIPSCEQKKMFSGIFKNFYIFRYYGCGVKDDKEIDFIKVITLQDSSDIITMYPFENEENYPYIDITPKMIVQDGEKTIIKRMSQIDKFNKRYGL